MEITTYFNDRNSPYQKTVFVDGTLTLYRLRLRKDTIPTAYMICTKDGIQERGLQCKDKPFKPLKLAVIKKWSCYADTCPEKENREAYDAFLDYLVQVYPETKYAMQKFKNLQMYSLPMIYTYLAYRSVPQTETLIGLVSGGREHTDGYGDYYNLRNPFEALSRRWLKAPLAERNMYIHNWIRYYSGGTTYGRYHSYNNILLTPSEAIVNAFIKDKVGVPTTKEDIEWLLRRKNLPSLKAIKEIEMHSNPYIASHISGFIYEYRDYLCMLQDDGRNIQDPYWRHNNRYLEIHAEHIRIADEQREKQDEQCRLEFKERYAKYTGYELKEGSLRAYISNDMDVWKKQAVALSQCIVACKYWAKQSSIIIFVERDGKPDSTSEYDINKKEIIQAYADESTEARKEGRLYQTNDTKELIQKFIHMYF